MAYIWEDFGESCDTKFSLKKIQVQAMSMKKLQLF